MNRYILKKIGWAFLTVGFVLALNFFLFRILPGDPAKAVRDPRLTRETVEAIRVRFGLDKPVMNCIEQVSPLELGSCLVNPLETQFGRYLANLFQGELGTSFHTQRPVADMLAESLVNTILLIGPGTLLSIILGVLLGLVVSLDGKPWGVWLWDGICCCVRVTVSTPTFSPRRLVVSPGPLPSPIGARPCMLGSCVVVRPSPPKVVPMREKSAVFCEMGRSWPSQKAQPRGAKLPAKILISAMKGSDMLLPLFLWLRFLWLRLLWVRFVAASGSASCATDRFRRGR